MPIDCHSRYRVGCFDMPVTVAISVVDSSYSDEQQINFYINFYLKEDLQVEFIGLLRRTDAKGVRGYHVSCMTHITAIPVIHVDSLENMCRCSMAHLHYL